MLLPFPHFTLVTFVTKWLILTVYFELCPAVWGVDAICLCEGREGGVLKNQKGDIILKGIKLLNYFRKLCKLGGNESWLLIYLHRKEFVVCDQWVGGRPRLTMRLLIHSDQTMPAPQIDIWQTITGNTHTHFHMVTSLTAMENKTGFLDMASVSLTDLTESVKSPKKMAMNVWEKVTILSFNVLNQSNIIYSISESTWGGCIY